MDVMKRAQLKKARPARTTVRNEVPDMRTPSGRLLRF
ncbi:hypothetical protein HD596_000871 [Nonomuraea jabiensis]|uniref:Uncharacterized protein n=1 Tax=Nonomuraea jabiensis TaxID=882448 RepID=A0A7W9L857_9ACTN|nr:hypothetical protein [Nonomuraea jabiensis]